MDKQTFLAILGRQAEISLAELESLFVDIRKLSPELAEFKLDEKTAPITGVAHSRSDGQVEILPDLRRLGGSQKLAKLITTEIRVFVQNWVESCPDGKITLAVSDYTPAANAFRTQGEALKLKKLLVKSGRNVRVLPNKTATIPSATSFHNHMWAPCHLELIKFRKNWYQVFAVQDIDTYAERDQARPARDAKVGMLPPKLAQILINLCGPLPAGARVLDPFCGTGVVLQEATLMGYTPYGTDINERMVEYSRRNLEWLAQSAERTDYRSEGALAGYDRERRMRDPRDGGRTRHLVPTKGNLSASRSGIDFELAVGDATDFRWQSPIDAVACEAFLGQPMSTAPAEIKLKQEKQRCKEILRGFLRNLSEQITSGTPVVIAVPAWLRPDGHYDRLNLLDDMGELRYNVESFKNNLGRNGLLYYRDGQIVAREIIVLRKQ